MTTEARDGYETYYADKLWRLLPALYRAQDTDQFDSNGPLRELVDRIGGAVGDIRRSVDRLWENQSIETCDDWAIPYLGDLLDTRVILGLDSRGQRLDVANTINYRRRKGTVGLIEQLASDITGWDAKVVEFFRRLGRTRHGLDPAIGRTAPADSDAGRLQRAEGLIGRLSGTGIGGFADLRNNAVSGKSRTAFDEYFHTADVRAGDGLFGWHAIPHLGIFVWRLISLQVGPVTPVAVAGCPGWYTFDPTGRDVALFATSRGSDAFGQRWLSPREGQLPGPIGQALLDADLAAVAAKGPEALDLYPDALAVWQGANLSPPDPILLDATSVTLRPEQGRFQTLASPPVGEPTAQYRYGVASLIGAGPYDRRGQATTIDTPGPQAIVRGGGGALVTALPSSGTLTIADSLTYAGAADLLVTDALTLRSANSERPLIRLDPATPWVITGSGPETTLILDGLFVSGQDIVLRGTFANLTITCSTLDPGSAAGGSDESSPPSHPYRSAADGRDLVPTRLWIEGSVRRLTADRAILGPIRTREGGTVETLTLSNSIVQAIPSRTASRLTRTQVKDVVRLARSLQLGLDPVAAHLRSLDPEFAAIFGAIETPPTATPVPPRATFAPMVKQLNELINGAPLYDATAFAGVRLTAATRQLLAATTTLDPAPALNRRLLEDAFPVALADAALAFANGTVSLGRCTILGRIVAHRFSASECILQELAEVDDLQDGCVRFSAFASGSRLPRQYESVAIPEDAPMFSSAVFGDPGFGQLLPNVDAQRIAPTDPDAPFNSISTGAEDGSEMGAYARDRNPIRAEALLIKLAEYMPAGLVPVIVNVT